jgi:hypothetical protein
MWFVGFTNRPNVTHNYACFVVSNSSSFAVVPSDIYTVEARTASGQIFNVPHGFIDDSRILRPHESQLLMTYVSVTKDQTTWKVEMTFDQVEGYLDNALRRLQTALYVAGLPVGLKRLQRCRTDSGWLTE